MFANRPKHHGIYVFNALNNKVNCCVVTTTMLYDPKEMRIQSVCNDEHVSVCSALL